MSGNLLNNTLKFVTIERFRVRINGKHEFVPHEQVFHQLVLYHSLDLLPPN